MGKASEMLLAMREAIKEKAEKISLAIATPAYMSQIFTPYKMASDATLRLLWELGIDCDVIDISGDSYVQRAKNTLITKVHKGKKFTHILMIDSDMSWNPDAVLTMLMCDKELIGGAYPTKNNWDNWGVKIHTKDGIPIGDAKIPLIRAHYVSGGFLMMKMEAIDRLVNAYPDLRYWGAPLRGSENEEYYNFFECQIIPWKDGKKQFQGEDITFMQRFRDAGGEIWLYPNISFGHYGINGWHGNYHEFLLSCPGGPKITIEKARYFTEERSLDVTDAIRSLVNSDGLNIVASNDIGGDPHCGKAKTLSIDYVLDGIKRTATAKEGERVCIQRNPATVEKPECKVFTDIIIPSYNNEDLTAQCFKSIREHTKAGTFRIIWVDNGSTCMAKAKAELAGVNHICIALTENKGFVGAVNEGLRISNAPTVCMLNNDTVVTEGWLEKLVNALNSDPRHGIVGSLTGYGVGTGVDSHHSLTLHSGLLPQEARDWNIDKINAELEKGYSGRTTNVDFVAFLCAVIKREVIEKVGLLDPNYEMGMWDDVDYNKAIQAAGYDIALAIDTCIYHRGRATFDVVEKEEGLDVGELLKKNKAYLDRKWSGGKQNVVRKSNAVMLALYPYNSQGLDAWLDHGAGMTYTAVKKAGLDIDFIDMKALHNENELRDRLKGYEIVAFGLKSSYYATGMKIVEIAKSQGSKVFVGGYHCFTGDTKIPLLNGTELSLAELTKDYSTKQFYVYSCDENGNIVSGLAHSPRKTTENVPILKVTLDNGEEIKCTYEHRFLMRDGTYREARHLKPEDSLMPLYRKKELYYGPREYESVYNPKTNEWLWTHKISEPICPRGCVRHHMDFNRFNNSPDNLKILPKDEHIKLHSKLGTNKITEYNKSEKARQCSSKHMKKLRSDSEWRGKRQIASSKTQPLRTKKLIEYNKSEKGKAHLMSMLGYVHSLPRTERQTDVSKRTILKAIEASAKLPRTTKQIESAKISILKARAIGSQLPRSDAQMEHNTKQGKHMSSLPRTEKQLEACRNNGRKINAKKNNHIYWHINRNITNPECVYCQEPQIINHKVASIEPCGCEDVYDITVEKYHNFALSSGVFVHNCTAAPQELLENPAIDWVLHGESEITFPQFLKNPDSFPREIWGEKPQNLDELPFMDRSMYRDPWEPCQGWWYGGQRSRMVTVMSARGCYFSCGFCQPLERNHFGAKVRRRSVDSIISELLILKGKYNPDCVMIHDDTFLAVPSWIEEFVEKYPQVGLPFWASGRADGICNHPDLVKRLVGVGWELISVGFESGSQRILDLMKKGTTVEQNLEAARIIKSCGAKIYGNYMIGLPWETKEDAEATFTMAREINAEMPSFASFSPYPGNALGERCIEEGLSLLDRNNYDRCPSGIKCKGVDYDYVYGRLAEFQAGNQLLGRG